MLHKHRLFLIILILLFAGAIFLLANRAEAPTTETPSTTEPTAVYRDLIEVSSLKASDRVTSPLIVEGRARGNWYFEASFPVDLVDMEGTVIASGIAQAQGDWMTIEFVPFSVTLTFSQPKTRTGVLRLKKDNPSGDPVNDDLFEIPVKFN